MREKPSSIISFSLGLVGVVCVIAGVAFLGDGLTGAVIGPPTNVSMAGGVALALVGIFSIVISRRHAIGKTLDDTMSTTHRTAYVVLDTGALIEAYHDDPERFSDNLAGGHRTQYIITQQVYAELRNQYDADRSYDGRDVPADNHARSPIRPQKTQKNDRKASGRNADDWKTRTDHSKLVPWTMMAAIDSLIASGAIHKIDAMMPLDRQTALIEMLKSYPGNRKRNIRIGQGDLSCVYFAETFRGDEVSVVSPDSDIPMLFDAAGQRAAVYPTLREYLSIRRSR